MAKETIQKICARYMSPRWQIVATLILVSLLGGMLYKTLVTFGIEETEPGTVPFISHAKEPAADTAVPVDVGLTILNFPKFEAAENSFIADILVWFRFDPNQIAQKEIEKFSFDQGSISNKTFVGSKQEGDKKTIYYRLRLEFSAPLEHRLFPLNDHRLFITLKNEEASPTEFRFRAPKSSFVMAPRARTSIWKVVNKETQTGYFKTQLDEEDTTIQFLYPAVVFSLDLARRGFKNVFLIMLPMLILFILSSFTLLLDPEKIATSIIGLSTGTLTGLIAYRFVIQRVEPDVVYFTLTDHIFNLFLVAIFAIFIINLLAVRHRKNDIFMRSIKGLVLFIIQLTLLISFYVIRL